MCTQAAEEAAESELAECQSTLRAAEEDCQAADQRMKRLQVRTDLIEHHQQVEKELQAVHLGHQLAAERELLAR